LAVSTFGLRFLVSFPDATVSGELSWVTNGVLGVFDDTRMRLFLRRHRRREKGQTLEQLIEDFDE
jgi:hypothetical protein